MDDHHTAREIFAAALQAVDLRQVLPPHLEQVLDRYREGEFHRLVVAGFGKGALPMALAAEAVLREEIAAGLVIIPHGSDHSVLPRRIQVAQGSHPHPDERSVQATGRLMELARGVDRHTLLLLLISGGGSALCCAPAPGITLEDKRETARLLMEASADIGQLNTVRKHLSAVKGGQLAAIACPAEVLALAVSDVPGDRLEVIASGPAVPDPSTFGEALAVVQGLQLSRRIPERVMRRLEQGTAGDHPETPKPGDPVFSRVKNTVVSTNRAALESAAREARRHGLAASLLEEAVTGEARLAGRRLAELALQHRARLEKGEALCMISGGETTVKVIGGGKGGRNQELALGFALAVEGESGLILLSAGTDGIDGPTDAAGALVDGNTARAARAAGLAPEAFLENNDSYPLLERCGALLKTGPTGTNVMDLQIVLVRG